MNAHRSLNNYGRALHYQHSHSLASMEKISAVPLSIGYVLRNPYRLTIGATPKLTKVLALSASKPASTQPHRETRFAKTLDIYSPFLFVFICHTYHYPLWRKDRDSCSKLSHSSWIRKHLHRFALYQTQPVFHSLRHLVIVSGFHFV